MPIRSLTATHSIGASRSAAARSAARPVRPSPLMAARMDMRCSSVVIGGPMLRGPRRRAIRRPHSTARGFPAVGGAVSPDAGRRRAPDAGPMETQEPFKPPKRIVEIALDSFWIAALFAIAFYLFGLLIGVAGPGELGYVTVAFIVLCVLW